LVGSQLSLGTELEKILGVLSEAESLIGLETLPETDSEQKDGRDSCRRRLLQTPKEVGDQLVARYFLRLEGGEKFTTVLRNTGQGEDVSLELESLYREPLKILDQLQGVPQDNLPKHFLDLGVLPEPVLVENLKPGQQIVQVSAESEFQARIQQAIQPVFDDLLALPARNLEGIGPSFLILPEQTSALE
jgi:hypothetical protein